MLGVAWNPFILHRKAEMSEPINFDQVPFGGTSDFVDNPEPRCPCVLVLDISYSMHGQPIAELNDGLKTFRQELDSDDLALKRVEIAQVLFGPVQSNDFEGAASWQPPHLTAQGDTPMGQAIDKALDLVRTRKDEYRRNGISYFRPWIFLITDGAPTDTWQSAAQRVHQGEANKEFSFFAVGVQGADMSTLKQISPPERAPLALRGLAFRELFRWLSESMKSVSRSQPGDAVTIPAPTGWAVIG